jgi:hypothetical protein
MDNNQNVEHGHVSLAVSLVGAVFAWINGHNVSETVKAMAGLVSIVAGVMAIRYYYYATIKAKK